MRNKVVVSILISLIVLTSRTLAFSDVPKDFWAYEAINFMQEKGIVSGFKEDGTFRPSELATREQTATILRNFFELELKNNVKKFEDVDVNSWSRIHIDLASQYLYDEQSDKFRPYDFATRKEVAEAVVRILDLDIEEPKYELIENFKDRNSFSEKESKVIALALENGIMKGYDDGTFLPNGKITRAEICALLYNTFTKEDKLLEKNDEEMLIKVEGEEILVKDFKMYFKVQKKIIEMLFGTDEIWYQEVEGVALNSTCKQITKEEIIRIKLICKKAEELGIKIDDETNKQFKEHVKTAEAKSICDYYGISEEEMLVILKESQINELLAKHIYDSIDHSKHNHKDINALKEEVSYDVRHILILTQNKSEEDARELAASLFVRVNNGEDFAKLANEYSEDGGSNKNGGLYENIKLGEFVKEIENVGVNGEVGKVYQELVKTSYGYHIVKAEGRRTEKIPMTETEKLTIINEDFNQIVSDWVENANITINEELYNKI